MSFRLRSIVPQGLAQASTVLAFLAGAVLRLWNLGPQILGGDELHGVRAALHLPLGTILRTYQEADNCIPLTAFYKLWGMAGGALTETVVRLPIVLSGLALLWLLPRALRGRLPPATLAIFAWLLALSPLLVAYSRIARSYLPLVLFGSLSVLAFERWWHAPAEEPNRRRRDFALYLGFGALATWFHLGAATFVAAPGLYVLVDLAADRAGRWPKLRRLTAAGIGMAAAFALFLVPAWGSLRALVAGKRQAQDVPWRQVVPDVFRLFAGTAQGWVALAFGLLALSGLVRLFCGERRERRLALFTLLLAIGHTIGLLLLSPLGLAAPLILGRYLLPLLPLLLLWVACGLGLPLHRAGESGEQEEGRTPGRLQATMAALAIAALLFSGPLLDSDLAASSFAHHNDYVRFITPPTRLDPAEVPELYRRLAGEPNGGALVEFPWLAVWEANRSFYAYQAVHRRRVIVSTPQRLLFRPPARLRNVVPPDPSALCASGAALVVVHRNIDREEDRIARGGREPVVSRRMRQQLRELAGALSGRLQAAWGAPSYADDWIDAWDLRAACGGGSRAP